MIDGQINGYRDRQIYKQARNKHISGSFNVRREKCYVTNIKPVAFKELAF